MPLKRTPPQSPAPVSQLVQQPISSALRCLSEPELCASTVAQVGKTTEVASGISTRSKRKRGEHDYESDFCAFKAEIFNLFKDMKEDQQKNFSMIRATMEDIKSQNTKLQESVEFISAKYDEVLLKIGVLEEDRAKSHKYIQSLEERIDYMERQSRLTSVEIRNVPKKPNETKQDLCDHVTNLSKMLNISVQSTDLKDIFRINTRSSNKTIIADFTTVIAKDNLLKSVRMYNKKHKDDKFNSTHLRLDGPKVPIFISENLSARTKRLFYLARDYARLNNYKYCWTAYGKVFMRKQDGDMQHPINSELDLQKLGKN